MIRRTLRRAVDSGLWAAGAVGGFLGTVSMTAFREPTARSLPPTARFWVRYVADGAPDDHPLPAFALHLLYGVGAGVAYAALLPRHVRDSASLSHSLAFGAAYGGVLSAFGSRVVLPGLLDLELSADESALFHAGHVVYGLSLGAWVGTRQSNREQDVEDAFEHS